MPQVPPVSSLSFCSGSTTSPFICRANRAAYSHPTLSPVPAAPAAPCPTHSRDERTAPALPPHACTQTRDTARAIRASRAARPCMALPCSNLLASLMTSHEVMHEFCGRFPLRKQIQKYSRNTHHPEPSVFRSIAQIRTYPFAVLFAKEPLYF